MLTRKPYIISRDKVIINYQSLSCDTHDSLLRSELFEEIIRRFLTKVGKENPICQLVSDNLPESKRDNPANYMATLYRLLFSYNTDEIMEMNEEHKIIFSRIGLLFDFTEGLYNYWRRFERFIFLEQPQRTAVAKSSLYLGQFVKYNEEFKNLILQIHRRVLENLTGTFPRVYRQLPAGANMGVLLEKIDWQYPAYLKILQEIPFVRHSLIEPPLILYPKMNTRKGQFDEIFERPYEIDTLAPDEWFCFPAKIGDLTAFIYFHQDFISQGLSLSNLFEIADQKEIEGKKPDMIILFGLKDWKYEGKSLFYEDTENDVLLGLVQNVEEIDYFGYFKKLPLTLHNIAMIKRKRLPVHGAMVFIKLKNGREASIVLVGDSGAGKSETLEALRMLSGEHICDMKIIFDDMGSIGINDDQTIVGYGTEIGAFVRLDDLQPGYAYEEIDRSIFMNPNRINSRLIIPITRYRYLIQGFPVDMFLYANNYDQVDENSSPIDFFNNYEEALYVFKSGARFAKGTTEEKGLVHTYFANPFGAPQRKELHEQCAKDYFRTMFEHKIQVGQIRTRLGIKDFEQEGPRSAALALFEAIQKMGDE